jgi:fibronectin type 3 domain-containing protein
MSDAVPAADWLGQRIAVAVRTSSKNEGHFSAWSNVVRLDVVSPLQPPTVETEPTADGIRLRWKPAPEGTTFRVFRSGPGDQTPTEIGTAKTGEFLDKSAQFDVAYTYQVVATHGAAESLPSVAATITAKDVFPPTVPTGVAALATPDSIEISWQRSPERDLKGYYLYRSANGGAFERLGDLLSLPTYSDRSAERGKTYRYEVSSVDQKNNESAKSSPVEVTF